MELEKEQIDYLIKECNSLMKERQEVLDLQEKRLSSYSIILAFSIAFIGYLLQNTEKLNDYPIIIPLFLFIAGITIIFTGLITFRRITYRQIQFDRYRLKIIEIKTIIKTQLKFNDDITKILSHDIYEIKGIRKWWLSISTIVALLNSFLITLYICSFLRILVFVDIQNRAFLVLIAFLVYTFPIFVHYHYIPTQSTNET